MKEESTATTITAAVVKPGWQTTEFWSLAIGSTIAVLNKAFGWNIDPTSIVVVGGMIASYALARSVTKHASVTAATKS